MDISGDAWDGIGEMKEHVNLGIDLAAPFVAGAWPATQEPGLILA